MIKKLSRKKRKEFFQLSRVTEKIQYSFNSKSMTFSLGIVGLSVARDEWISMKGHREKQHLNWDDPYDWSLPTKFGSLNTNFRYIELLRRVRRITITSPSVMISLTVGCDLLGRKVVYNFLTISSNLVFERFKLSGGIN